MRKENSQIDPEVVAANERETIYERSADTQTLVDHLSGVEVGEKVSYKKLSNMIQRDVQHDAAGILRSARNIVQRESSILFGTIRKFGIVRLSNSGIVETGEVTMTRIHRTTRTGAKRLACAEYAKLTPEDRTKYNAMAAGLGALHAMTGRSSLRKLTKAAGEAEHKMDFQRTLSVFGSNPNGKDDE